MPEETNNNPDATKAEFDEQGFVALRGFMNPDEVAEVQENLNRFIRDIVPTMPKEHVFYEDKADKSTLKQLQGLADRDPFFQQLMIGGRFENLAETLLNDRAIGQNLQYFCKPPGGGKPTPPHQDGYYFKLKPCEAITLWFALDEVDEENGCVRYVRGSHRRGMRPHGRTTTLGFSQGIADYGTPEDTENETPITASPGDLLAHHAMTVHRADGNNSQTRYRRALGFVYFTERARIDEEAKAAYQKLLEREMAAEGKI